MKDVVTGKLPDPDTGGELIETNGALVGELHVAAVLLLLLLLLLLFVVMLLLLLLLLLLFVVKLPSVSCVVSQVLRCLLVLLHL